LLIHLVLFCLHVSQLFIILFFGYESSFFGVLQGGSKGFLEFIRSSFVGFSQLGGEICLQGSDLGSSEFG